MSIQCAASSDTASLTSGLPNKYPITISGWVYIPSTLASIGSAWTIAVRSDSSDDTWALQIKSISGSYKFGGYSSGGGDVYGTSAVSTNTWHNLTITVSAGGAITGYLDGTVDSGITGTLSSSITATTFQLGHSVAGDNAPFSTAGASFYGFKVWNAELTSGQVTTEQTSYSPVLATNLYGSWLLPNVTTLTDDSGNGHNFARTGFVNDSDPAPLGGGGTSVAITGNAGTGSSGSVAQSFSLALTAPGATGSPGTVAPSFSKGITASGATGSPGSVVATRSLGLTAQGATGSPGSVGVTVSVALTGVSGTGSVGNVSPAGPTLSSSPGTGAAGTVAPSASFGVTGAAATGSPGTPGANITISISGVGGAGSPGTVGKTFAIGAIGLSATSAAGSLGVGARSIAIAGSFATGGVGTITPGLGLNSAPIPPYNCSVTFSLLQSYDAAFNPSLASGATFCALESVFVEIE